MENVKQDIIINGIRFESTVHTNSQLKIGAFIFLYVGILGVSFWFLYMCLFK